MRTALDPRDVYTRENLGTDRNNERIRLRQPLHELGAALWLVAVHFKRCVQSEWLAVRTTSSNGSLCHRTPKDFAERGHIAANILRVSVSFFREARERHAEIVSRAFDMPFVVPDVSCLEYS